jgi:hypothetical protein
MDDDEIRDYLKKRRAKPRGRVVREFTMSEDEFRRAFPGVHLEDDDEEGEEGEEGEGEPAQPEPKVKRGYFG